MDITVSKQMGNEQVTILKLAGELDGQTYQGLISRAKELYGSGARNFLLDMSELTYVSSAGLVAMHTIAMLLKGEAAPDPDDGWGSMRSVKKTSDGKMQEHMKLLNPLPEVRSVLEMVGFDRAFEIHSSLEDAVKSF